MCTECLTVRRNQRDIIVNVRSPSCKVPVFLVRFKSDLNFLDKLSSNPKLSNSMEICPVGAKLVNANGQIDGQTDMTKRIVAFRNLRKRLER